MFSVNIGIKHIDLSINIQHSANHYHKQARCLQYRLLKTQQLLTDRKPASIEYCNIIWSGLNPEYDAFLHHVNYKQVLKAKGSHKINIPFLINLNILSLFINGIVLRC